MPEHPGLQAPKTRALYTGLRTAGLGRQTNGALRGVVLSTYARWIDAGQDDKEVAKLEQSMADARADAQALKIASAGDD
jgi:hypothetical protein